MGNKTLTRNISSRADYFHKQHVPLCRDSQFETPAMASTHTKLSRTLCHYPEPAPIEPELVAAFENKIIELLIKPSGRVCNY